MDLNGFLLKATEALSKNTTIIEGIRDTLNTFQTRLYSIPTLQDLKSEVKTLDDNIKVVITRLDAIDKWQKVRLPIVVGIITLLLYSIGFFFTLNRVSNMIQDKHPQQIEQPIKKAGPD